MATAYKNHRAGSAMGAVHKVFDERGKDAAKKKGEDLGLKPHTVRAAISLWERKIFSRSAPSGKKAKKAKKVARVARKTGKAAKAKKVARAARPAKKVAKVARAARPAKKATGESAAA